MWPKILYLISIILLLKPAFFHCVLFFCCLFILPCFAWVLQLDSESGVRCDSSQYCTSRLCQQQQQQSLPVLTFLTETLIKCLIAEEWCMVHKKTTKQLVHATASWKEHESNVARNSSAAAYHLSSGDGSAVEAVGLALTDGCTVVPFSRTPASGCVIGDMNLFELSPKFCFYFQTGKYCQIHQLHWALKADISINRNTPNKTQDCPEWNGGARGGQQLDKILESD